MADATDGPAMLARENSRLSAELEQARTAAESSQDAIEAMSAELDRLREELRGRTQASRAAESAMERLRSNLSSTSASLFALESEHARGSTAEEELRVAVEELQVLAEELEAANESLRTANMELDRRVAQRTAELAIANTALAEHNRELERRVEAAVAAREAAQAALFRQQKLEALGQLTGGVAHDFNNLLTVVVSGLHMLGRAQTEERREMLIGRIGEAAERGATLTHRLLAFGRRQALRPEPLDLAARLSDLCDLLGHSLRGDLRIEAQAEEGLWPVEADLGALELALLNLAVNARDAMPHGGRVALAARNRQFGEREAAALGLAEGDYVELSVADSGTGMSREVLARVFEPFFTTKDAGQGSGLGLAQVYGFAQQSGGTARVESQPGEGATVSLLLPRSASAPSTAAPPRRPAVDGRAETPGEGGHRAASILVVEDDGEVGALVVDMLTQLGHCATRVSNVDAALGALGNGRVLDLVFTDVLLPGGANGVDLAHEIRRRRPEIGVVLTSGYGGEMIEQMGQVHWPLLRKPYQPETLRAVIEAALDAPHDPDAWQPRQAVATVH